MSLRAPAIPASAGIIRLQARLFRPGRLPITVWSSHPGRQEPRPVAVELGTYTLVYLDERGQPTDVTETIAVTSTQTALSIPVSSVWIHPASAAFTTETFTSTPTLQIEVNGRLLKTVMPVVNTVIDLPATGTTLRALPAGFEQPALRVGTPGELLILRLGSVYVRKSLRQTVSILDSEGGLLIPSALDGIEYLLFAAPRSTGCVVYLGKVDKAQAVPISLCSDDIAHWIFDVRR